MVKRYYLGAAAPRWSGLRVWWPRTRMYRTSTLGLAVGETVILMAPPCTCSRCFNRDKQGVSVK